MIGWLALGAVAFVAPLIVLWCGIVVAHDYDRGTQTDYRLRKLGIKTK